MKQLGQRTGDVRHLEEALQVLSDALEERNEATEPLSWAMTKNSLGGAFKILGERCGDTQKLEQSVVHYTDALRYRTRDTDESFERWEAINAERLLEMRREPDEHADTAIERLADCMTAPATIGHLVDHANLGGRAFPAIFRAIYSGVLRQIEDGTINLTTIVEKGTVQ